MRKSIPLPSDCTNPIVLADWLELIALTSADGNSSHGDLQRALNRLSVDNIETLCTESMSELHKRVIATGDSYPFTFSGTLLKMKTNFETFTPYLFCLFLSFFKDEEKKIQGYNHEIMFEKLSCIAAAKYIDGQYLRFGSPRDTIPKGFLDALNHICGAVGEWNCPRGRNTLQKKDDGLDLIAWKHFPDKQVGKLILFGHCASGNNWDDKVNELQPHDFCTRWLGGDRSPIVKTFFIPHRLSPEIFEDRAISAKLFFDRCRIAYWAPADDFKKITNGHNLLWCNKLLKKVTK